MKFGMFYPVAVASEADLEIQRLKDTLDVEYIIFVMYGGITEQKRMLESIRLFGEKVIPKFADAKTAEPALATA
jgi:hypothetical protein